RPKPICAVFRELKTERTFRFWREELFRLRHPPFSSGPDTLFVAYYASAELGCFLSLGWSLPTYVLDLYTQFRALTNGSAIPSGNGLLGALIAFGLHAMAAHEKNAKRDLVMRGGPWSDSERQEILEYCTHDVLALEDLLEVMLPHIV